MRFSTKAITTCAVLAALALALSYLESFFPPLLPLPGVKLGLANIVTVYALYALGASNALAILVVRCLLGSLFAGNASALLFSLLGGLAAMLVMIALHALPRLSVYGVSVGGAAAHNCGQVAAAMLTLGSAAPLAYLPFLLLVSVFTGALTGFVAALLDGHGVSGNGAFPDGFAGFGGEHITTESYDPEGAKQVLEDAGWTDTDGDGIREKDGVKLTIRWLTYPSRQELPLLAESAQATLKEIGMDVDINCTANRREFLADMTSWDIYASAMVTAPSGDPQYFFTSCCVPGMSYNFGAYENEEVNALIDELAAEFDTEKRAELAVKLQQAILDDNAYVFCSFLQMNMISKSTVTGYTAHACDYYQVTAELDINE